MGRDGWPLSWRHFVYGRKHLERARAREDLRLAGAANLGSMAQKDAEKWYRTNNRIAWGR